MTAPRIGLRCEAMVILGALWVLMGLGVELGASQPPAGLPFMVVPARIRAVVWVVTGLASVWTAWRSDRTPWALAGLAVMPLARCSSYLWAWGLALWPGDQMGELPHGWYSAGFYAAMLAGVWVVAHIPPGLLRVAPSPDRERGHQA